uniref:Uncharacterized protein n=1 Tax=Oryza nivara TaxID=4536 RepID=A0A0E0FXT6_ORYNI
MPSKIFLVFTSAYKHSFKLGRQQWEGMLTGMKICLGCLAAELDTTHIYKDEAGECLMIPTVSTLYIIIPMGCAWKISEECQVVNVSLKTDSWRTEDHHLKMPKQDLKTIMCRGKMSLAPTKTQLLSFSQGSSG